MAKLSEHLLLNTFGSHIRVPQSEKWHRLIYFDEDDQHLEYFDEDLRIVLSSNDFTLDDIEVLVQQSPNVFFSSFDKETQIDANDATEYLVLNSLKKEE